jgi:hypothetical protein
MPKSAKGPKATGFRRQGQSGFREAHVIAIAAIPGGNGAIENEIKALGGWRGGGARRWSRRPNVNRRK